MTNFEITFILILMTLFVLGMIIFIRKLNEEARITRLTKRNTFYIK